MINLGGTGQILLGGHPQLPMWQDLNADWFIGCMFKVILNGRLLDLYHKPNVANPVTGENIGK